MRRDGVAPSLNIDRRSPTTSGRGFIALTSGSHDESWSAAEVDPNIVVVALSPLGQRLDHGHLIISVLGRSQSRPSESGGIFDAPSGRGPYSRTPCEFGDPNRPGDVEQSLQPEFSITLGCVSSGEQTGCFFDVDGLHQYAFLPIGYVRLALA